jgi:DNA ligase (NAD+)
VSEKELDYNMHLVVWGDHRLSKQRSKLISRGREIAESLDKLALTVVRDIIVEIDTNGSLKRRAILDPVSIEGKLITDVSLGYAFNEKNLLPERKESYDFRIGDTVTIERISGFFMPTNVVKEKRTGNEKVFTMPDKCPACGSKIETPRPDCAYRCTGTACPGRIKAQLMAFSDLMRMDLDPELARELVDKKMVWDPADLYFLRKKDLMQLNKMDEDSAQRLLDAIEKSRHPELVDILSALLMTGDFPLGKSIGLGIELSVHCNSISDLLDAGVLARIKSIWIKPNDLIKKLHKLMYDSTTSKFLEKLKRGGVIFPRKSGD